MKFQKRKSFPRFWLLIGYFSFNCFFSYAHTLNCPIDLNLIFGNSESRRAELLSHLKQQGILVVKNSNYLPTFSDAQADYLFSKHCPIHGVRKLLRAGLTEDPQSDRVALEALGEPLAISYYVALKQIARKLFEGVEGIGFDAFYLIFENASSIRAKSFHADKAVATLIFQIYGDPETGTEFIEAAFVESRSGFFRDLKKIKLFKVVQGSYAPTQFVAQKEGVRTTQGGEQLMITLGYQAGRVFEGGANPGFHRASLKKPKNRRILAILSVGLKN